MSGLRGGVKRLTGAELAEQDQHEAEFDRIEFHPGTVEAKLSKGDAGRWAGTAKMAAFLACLERWARRMADDGYEIRAEPYEGPGTMAWKAVKK